MGALRQPSAYHDLDSPSPRLPNRLCKIQVPLCRDSRYTAPHESVSGIPAGLEIFGTPR
jgi:hypothetical protein